MEISKRSLVKDRNEWRQWLEENHDKEKEIWVIFYRKNTGRQTISVPEAIDEPLCFGWTDSIEKKMDEEKFALRFTLRKRDSSWSKRNIERARGTDCRGKDDDTWF